MDHKAKLERLRSQMAQFGISAAVAMDMLSDDAKAVAGSVFGTMRPGHGTLTFRMIESRPTARMQAALDELEAAGLVECKPINQVGGKEYRVLANLNDFFVWMMNNIDRDDVRFRISEPIKSSATLYTEQRGNG